MATSDKVLNEMSEEALKLGHRLVHGVAKDIEALQFNTAIAKMMEAATGAKPKMWGPAIIGFGDVQLKYDSGRVLDWFKIGFSPRKANITLYMSFDLSKHKKTLDLLGKHKTGKGCLYINRLSDVDTNVLQQMIGECMKVNRKLSIVKKEND